MFLDLTNPIIFSFLIILIVNIIERPARSVYVSQELNFNKLYLAGVKTLKVGDLMMDLFYFLLDDRRQ